MATQKDYIGGAYIVDDYQSIEEDFIKFIEYIPLFLYPKEEDILYYHFNGFISSFRGISIKLFMGLVYNTSI